MRENFSFDLFVDPVGFFKDLLLGLVKFVVKVVLFGYILYYTMKKTGLKDNHSIMNYVKYLVVASIVMYFVSMTNMVFDCYMEGTEIQKMDFKQFALASIFVPVFVLVHVIALIVCGFLKPAPAVGIILQVLCWTSLYIVLITGVVYTLTYESVKLGIGCPSTGE